MMKRGLRLFVAVSVILTMVVGLAACSGNTKSNNTQGNEGKGEQQSNNKQENTNNTDTKTDDTKQAETKHDPVTLKLVWQIPPMNTDWTRVIEAFEKKFPWIKVETIYADGVPQVEKSIAAGDPVDIFWHSPFDDVMAKGLAEDLTPYAEKDKEFQAYPYRAGFLDRFKRDGKLYALSRSNDGLFVMYNTELLKQYGLEPPKPDWTWDDFKEMAKKATNPAEKHYGVGVWAWWYYCVLLTLPEANGHAPNLAAMNEDFTRNLADGSVPEVLDDLNFFNDMVKEGIMLNATKAKELGMGTGPGFTFDAGQSLFHVGISPHVIGWKNSFGFKWDIAPMPRGKAKQVNFGWLNPMFMAKASKHKEEAWEFMKFWDASKEGQKILLDIGATFPNSDDPELMEAYSNASAWRGFNRDALQLTPKITQYEPSVFMLGGSEVGPVFSNFATKGYEEGVSAYDYFPAEMQKVNEKLKELYANQKK